MLLTDFFSIVPFRFQATPSEVEALAAIRHINGVVLTTAGVHRQEKKVHRSVNQLIDDGAGRRKLEGKMGGVTVSKDQATATPKPPTTSLGDIFISVKTTKKNHDNRLELILNTWHQLAKHQVSRIFVLFCSILPVIEKKIERYCGGYT